MKVHTTCGRGTETFAENEVIGRLQAHVLSVEDGKVFFETESRSTDFNKILDLKTVERVFATIAHFPTVEIKGNGKVRFLHDLKGRILNPTALKEAAKLVQRRLAKECGVKLSLMLGWAVDLQSPQVEVCIHVNDDFVTAGIPFTQRPLSKRSYILDPGLRSTVSWIMAHVAEIQPTDRVLDPMCGKATVLLEAAMQNTKAAEFIGCDSNAEQLAVASKNITFAGLRSCVHLICADATNLPLSTASVEKIVCDAPFGQKFTTSTSLPSFYHKLLKELHRVLAPEGRLVLLTSQDLVPVVEHCIQRLHLEDAEHLSQQLIHDTVFDCSLSGRQEKLCGTHKTDDADDSSPHDTFQLTRSASSLRQLQNLAEESDDSVRCESVRLKENAVGSETQLPSVGQTGTDDLEGLVCTAVHTFKEEDDTKLSSVFSDGEVSEPTQKLVGKKKINAVDVPSSEFTLSQCDESSLHSKLSCSSSADPVADLKHLGCESLKTLCIKTKHYVKLGETHAYIMVMEKD
ncbi:hypothetical protein BaRGS_00039067 [Batillaria attramentaria]|uniref:Ribosomal RNA large subunit methyltransferase K/L-like methyltransferase domain-containing protein n=1 Tax=Batillaria attramentaria TaxID=370345 RepID=A0ABD0J4C8_9CAEN